MIDNDIKIDFREPDWLMAQILKELQTINRRLDIFEPIELEFGLEDMEVEGMEN